MKSITMTHIYLVVVSMYCMSTFDFIVYGSYSSEFSYYHFRSNPS